MEGKSEREEPGASQWLHLVKLLMTTCSANAE